MRSLIEIEKAILQVSKPYDRIIRGIWAVDCLYSPVNNGRTFDYKFFVSQTVGQGCAYSTKHDYSHQYLSQFINHDFADVTIEDLALKVSLLDSLYGHYFTNSKCQFYSCNGVSYKKMRWRTSIILDEVKKLLGKINNMHIVNVGVVGDILQTLKNEGAFVVGSDFDKNIVGSQAFEGINIVDGQYTLREIASADLAIVTGMTITTNTIDDIISCCANSNTKLIVFAETGANLAGYYIDAGVNVYISEEFPFYIFNGDSRIRVYHG